MQVVSKIMNGTAVHLKGALGCHAGATSVPELRHSTWGEERARDTMSPSIRTSENQIFLLTVDHEFLASSDSMEADK